MFFHFWLSKVIRRKTFFVSSLGVSVHLGFLNNSYHHFIAREYSKNRGEFELFARFIRESRNAKIIYDCGSYNGIYGLLAAKANPDVQVYLFECEPENIRQIENNITLNALTNAHLVAKAVWDKEELLKFDAGSGSSAGRIGESGYQVVATSIDAMAKVTGSPNLMKLDIEGAEYRVVRAMNTRMTILLEVHRNWMIDGSEKLLLQELEGKGYKIHPLDEGRRRYDVTNTLAHYWCTP